MGSGLRCNGGPGRRHGQHRHGYWRHTERLVQDCEEVLERIGHSEER